MPGTTRYSATFDRPYEEDELAQSKVSNGSRRSRSLSWQAHAGMDQGRPLLPLDRPRPAAVRSSSTDNGVDIPTRTVGKPAVKTHNNPFQFVKVGSCPLYKKAEEQLKKAKEVKKPDVLKEEEEEWQSNLDSWKSRRRKMSEDVFRRQEEIKQFEKEEQDNSLQNNQKKTKTFSEMVESRAHRGRALSLCLISSPLELQKWELENSNSSNPFSEGSEENSAVNSEDEGVGVKRTPPKKLHSSPINGNCNQNGTATNSLRNKSNKLFELGDNALHHSNGVYVDSGLESISSSHRAGDTPDSCSDFSQDSGSSIDCDSPRASGLLLNDVNLLEEFSKEETSREAFIDVKVSETETSPKENGITSRTMNLPNSNGYSACSVGSISPKSSTNDEAENHISHKGQRSVESENEVFVDDFGDHDVNVKVSSDEEVVKNEEKENEILSCQLSSNDSGFSHAPTSVVSSSSTSQSNSSTVVSNTADNTALQLSIKSKKHSREEKKSVPDSNEQTVKIKISKKKKSNITSAIPSNQTNRPSHEIQSELSSKRFDDTSLNIVFQSKPDRNNIGNSKKSKSSSCQELATLQDVPPVEQVAEEMERLILEQLEEEERAKEMSNKMRCPNLFGSPEHNITAPPKLTEPPKEKPPPPPNTESEVQKPNSLKRINSTKRIKKEIYKRRSNFLGIDADENDDCDEFTVQPPPGLEQILKAEMELDRENMKRLEHAAAERVKMEEKEIIKKEREIIETLEIEERRKQLVNNEEICDILQEEDRIQALKEERQRIEVERSQKEQRLRLEEEQRLREREEHINKQEVEPSLSLASEPISALLLSEAGNTSNPANTLNASLSGTVSHLLSSASGDGAQKNSLLVLTDGGKPEIAEKPTVPVKPAVPPKPLKKKEAIRKERERLRQEQEALQREREEHRLKLQLEQEEMAKTLPKSHADTVTLIGIRQKPIPPVRKPVQSEVYGQQKAHTVKKPVESSPPESKYNQNHWLIQEAEMRRISELKERQRLSGSQTHLPEDDLCSRVPDYSVCYGPLPIKKFPPPVPPQKPIGAHSREVVPPTKPSRVVPLEGREQMLSVSGRKRCSHCTEELGRGAAMIIESLQLYYHIQCFQCCVCQSQLGNGSCGTDVRVRNNKLHCHNCYSNDEAGLKFSQV